MNCFVTGASGFIGANLVHELVAREHGVKVLLLAADLQQGNYGHSYGCTFTAPSGESYSPDFAAYARAIPATYTDGLVRAEAKEAAAGEHLVERVGPACHLRAEALDHRDRRLGKLDDGGVGQTGDAVVFQHGFGR